MDPILFFSTCKCDSNFGQWTSTTAPGLELSHLTIAPVFAPSSASTSSLATTSTGPSTFVGYIHLPLVPCSLKICLDTVHLVFIPLCHLNQLLLLPYTLPLRPHLMLTLPLHLSSLPFTWKFGWPSLLSSHCSHPHWLLDQQKI